MSKFRVLVKGIVQYQDSYLAVERWYDDRIFDPYQWEFIDGEMEPGDLPQVRFVHVELLFCVMHRWMK